MTVLELVKKYPKIFPPLQDGKLNKQHLAVPAGWIPILNIMLSCIQDRIDSHTYVHQNDIYQCPQVVCQVMKEKFGSLVFSHTGGDGVTQGMINMTARVIDNICCICGDTNDLGMTVDYISTCCKQCFDNDRTPGSTWKSMEEIEKLENEHSTDGSQQS